MAKDLKKLLVIKFVLEGGSNIFELPLLIMYPYTAKRRGAYVFTSLHERNLEVKLNVRTIMIR